MTNFATSEDFVAFKSAMTDGKRPVFDYDRGDVPEVIDFQIILVDKYSGLTWTVLKFVDGENLGGDHHWLTPELAAFAKAAYQARPDLHGRPSSEVLPAGLGLLGK